jgi:4-diphosphocytidyl-2-C-methyl-D-erythritol kinase
MTSGSAPRRARVTALAKLNLDLRVLYRRPDNYHELRSIFQTVSLGDTIDVAFTAARTNSISLQDDRNIPDNLIVKAADLVMAERGPRGRVEFRLHKRIPMGGGLGGGSSDAAAVLLALPVLSGRAIPLDRLIELGAQLGSDVPFFLHGGTAAGIGRGTELIPLADTPPRPGVILSPGIHVSTAAAYAGLGPGLTLESVQNKIVSFQSRLWSQEEVWEQDGSRNDFETVVFAEHPKLASLKRKLLKLGARPAMMTGSGSALFGLFRSREEVSRAIQSIRGEVEVFPITLVSRRQYRSLWWKRLGEHVEEKQWPPRSRYVR